MNVFGYDPKGGSKHVHIAYTKPETGCIVILLINQAIEMMGLNHHILCPMQCHVNGVVIKKVPKVLTPIPSVTMHAI